MGEMPKRSSLQKKKKNESHLFHKVNVVWFFFGLDKISTQLEFKLQCLYLCFHFLFSVRILGLFDTFYFMGCPGYSHLPTRVIPEVESLHFLKIFKHYPHPNLLAQSPIASGNFFSLPEQIQEHILTQQCLALNLMIQTSAQTFIEKTFMTSLSKRSHQTFSSLLPNPICSYNLLYYDYIILYIGLCTYLMIVFELDG